MRAADVVDVADLERDREAGLQLRDGPHAVALRREVEPERVARVALGLAGADRDAMSIASWHRSRDASHWSSSIRIWP